MGVFDSRQVVMLNPMTENSLSNCGCDMLERSGGRIIKVSGVISGDNESLIVPLFKVTGSVEIIDAYAEITEVTNISNCTNCYFDLYDGATAVNITADGADLSGSPVGTLILKTLDSSQIATVVKADQTRITEADTSKKTHHPFIATQKNGAETVLRCHLTTNTTLEFSVDFYVVYRAKNSGKLEAY